WSDSWEIRAPARIVLAAAPGFAWEGRCRAGARPGRARQSRGKGRTSLRCPSRRSLAKHKLLPFHPGLDDHTRLEVTTEDALGQGIFDPALDGALEWAGAVDGVVADGDEFFPRCVAQLQAQLALGQALAQTAQLDLRNATDLVLAKRLEHHHLVDPVDEFRAEVLTHRIHYRCPLGLRIADQFLDLRRAQVGG